jgi:hypothetical protein
MWPDQEALNGAYGTAIRVVTACCVAVALFASTPLGLALSPDSVGYLKGAQGLVSGHGLSYVSVQWPPLYPCLIAAFAWLAGGDLALGARILNALCYALVYLFVAHMIRRHIGSPPAIEYLFSGLFCVNVGLTHVYLYAFSEALFLAFLTANFALICSAYKKGNLSELKPQILLALLGLFATTTRYVGVTIVAMNVFAVLIYLVKSSNNLTVVVKTIIIQVLPTAIFLALWRQHLGLGDIDANIRTFVVHVPTFENLTQGIATIGQWFYPITHVPPTATHSVTLPLGLLILVALPIIFFKTILQIKNEKIITAELIKTKTMQAFFQFIMCSYALGYIFFIILMRTFFDLNIIFDSRTLSPIFLPLCVLFLSIITNLKAFRLIAFAFFTLALSLSIADLKGWIQINYFNGVELNDKAYKTRPLVSFLQGCPSASLVAADQPWNLNLIFDTVVLWLPNATLYGSGLNNLNYYQQLTQLSQRVDLIVIENTKHQSVQDIEKLASFKTIYNASDGSVYIRNHLNDGFCDRIARRVD